MNKILEQVKEKIIIGVILSMLGIGGTFLYSTGKDLWNLPETVRSLKRLHTQDSIRAVHYVIKLDSISKIVDRHDIWLDSDYKSIERIKNKIKIKP